MKHILLLSFLPTFIGSFTCSALKLKRREEKTDGSKRRIEVQEREREKEERAGEKQVAAPVVKER